MNPKIMFWASKFFPIFQIFRRILIQIVLVVILMPFLQGSRAFFSITNRMINGYLEI